MSQTLYFSISGVLLLEWQNISWTPVPSFNLLYDGFLCAEKPRGEFPFYLVVQQGRPPMGNRNRLIRTAHNFSVGEDMVCCGHRHNKIRWTSWLGNFPVEGGQSMAGKTVRVWYEFSNNKRSVWPWMFFPELLVCFHVVQPVIEWLLMGRDIFFLHAGAVEKEGKALLLAGRGGVYKTSHIISLLQQGWSFLSDDLVILRDAMIWPTPLHVSFFDYFFRHCPDEKLTWVRMLGSFFWLRRKSPLGFAVGRPAFPGAINIILRKNDHQSLEWSDRPFDDHVARMLIASDRLEKLNFNELSEVRGRMFLHLDQCRGTSLWENYWHRYETAILKAFQGVPCRVIRMNPEQFEAGNIDYILAG